MPDSDGYSTTNTPVVNLYYRVKMVGHDNMFVPWLHGSRTDALANVPLNVPVKFSPRIETEKFIVSLSHTKKIKYDEKIIISIIRHRFCSRNDSN